MKKALYIYVFCIIVVLSASLLTSCYTTQYSYESLEPQYNSYYNNWTKAQIVNQCGAPDRIVPIEGKAEILVYEDYYTRAMSLDVFDFAKTTRNYTEFYLNKDLKCYQVKTNATQKHEYREKDPEKTIEGVLWGIVGLGLLLLTVQLF